MVITGANIIAGADSALGERNGASLSARDGEPVLEARFAWATPGEIDAAVDAALAAVEEMDAPAPARAARLSRIADALEANADAVIEIADAETALGTPRLTSEVARTAGQLRTYADAVAAGLDLEVVTSPADAAVGRPEIVKATVAIGPVAVFGAGNFPLAFGALGTDTASALAAGCPVIVKGHPSHPATTERVVRIALEALDGIAPAGALSLLHGAVETGRNLVVHPGVAAAAFTGSFQGGRSLIEATWSREVPIPVFAEMGSVNPVVVTRHAAAARGATIAEQLAAAITGSAGQLCTKPGVLFVPTGDDGTALVGELTELMGKSGPFTPLDARVGARLESRRAALAAVPSIQVRTDAERGATLFELDHADPALLEELAEEAFGPVAVVVRYGELGDVVAAVPTLSGQLTFSVFGEPADAELLRPLLTVARRQAGRLIWNGVPTGVAVVAAMHHGGPWPASSTALGSVGHEAIRRFRRPLALQGFPGDLVDGLVRAGEPTPA